MEFKHFTLLVLLLALFNVDDIDARRISGNSRSSGSRSRSSSGGHAHRSQSHATSVGHSSVPPSRTTSADHSSSSMGGTATSGQTAHQKNKDLSSTFLNAEGGGATRPAQSKPAQAGGLGGTYNPPVPPNNPRQPEFATDYRQNSSPYKPSAPPSAPSFSGQVGTSPKVDHGTPNYGNTQWSNPHLGQNQPTSSPWQPHHIGFQQHVYPQSTGHVNNSPYPPIHNNPPYPVAHNNPPYPVTHHSTAYPITHSNPAYPATHGNSPPPLGGPSFGYPTHPSAYHPNQVPISNPYSTGSAYAPGQPAYPQQGHYFAQPAAQPFVPGQTVLMVPANGQSDSGRGFGQMLKEALVFSTVNAAVNRVINPYHHDHRYVDSRPQETSVNNTTTHITYNNQYFNTLPGSNGSMSMTGVPPETLSGGNPNGGTFAGGNYPNGGTFVGGNYPNGGTLAGGNYPNGQTFADGNHPNAGIMAGGSNSNITAPTGSTPYASSSNLSNASNNQENSPTNAAVNRMPPRYRISDSELLKITEELFAQNTFNASKYVTLNLQTRVTSVNVTDGAEGPLFYIEPLLLDYPSIYVTRALYDNYEHDSRKKENRTLERRKEENLLIDTYLNTNVMVKALQWLSDRGFVDPDDFERKDILRHIWFNQFDGTSSGFERIFMSENYADTAILGMQNWLYFNYQEFRNRVNYMGYVGKLNIGDTASLLKLHFEMDGLVRPNATLFVGTMPEFEMALYTICYYARPNALCPVSLDGIKFNVYTHSFRYFGNDLIDLALPVVDSELFK